jgi:hypothetical protein
LGRNWCVLAQGNSKAGGSRFLQNGSKYLPDYTASRPKKTVPFTVADTRAFIHAYYTSDRIKLRLVGHIARMGDIRKPESDASF